MEEFELEPREVIVKEVRQHLFVLALRVIPLLVLAFLPWILFSALGFFAQMSPDATTMLMSMHISPGMVRFLTGIWLLFVWTAVFGLLTRYYLTVWVITSLRIVDIRQYGFFSREVSSFMLTRVQDVTTTVSGFLATLIGFGALSVETAGNDDNFFMHGIARPELVRDLIMRQVALLHDSGHADTGLS